jgi:PAS domain-containing protein
MISGRLLSNCRRNFFVLYVATSEFPYYILFIPLAILLAWFSAVRRRVERELLESCDELEKEVAVRTQQASLLNLSQDTIFVRDPSDVITYWNRGAQELYGWTAEEAVGKHTHQLLRTPQFDLVGNRRITTRVVLSVAYFPHLSAFME